jgi:hypothetical protein
MFNCVSRREVFTLNGTLGFWAYDQTWDRSIWKLTQRHKEISTRSTDAFVRVHQIGLNLISEWAGLVRRRPLGNLLTAVATISLIISHVGSTRRFRSSARSPRGTTRKTKCIIPFLEFSTMTGDALGYQATIPGRDRDSFQHSVDTHSSGTHPAYPTDVRKFSAKN